jgi:hypothetical protein
MKNSVDPVAFNYHILKRIFKILPRKSKEISMLYIDYASIPKDEESEIEIKYRVRNALWFINNNKKTISNRIVFTKPKDTNEEVKLTVQGLFRRHEYRFKLMQDHILLLK